MIRFYCDICKAELKDPDFYTDDALNFSWRRCTADAPFHVKYGGKLPNRLLLCEDCLDAVLDALERRILRKTDADE